MSTTLLAFRCGSCQSAQTVPQGNQGRAARCGCCMKAIRVPHSAIEVVDEEPACSAPPVAVAPPEPADSFSQQGDLSRPAANSPVKSKKSSDWAFLMLLCLAPALVSSMAVNVYLALQLRSAAAARQSVR